MSNEHADRLLAIAKQLGFENLGIDGGGHYLMRHPNGKTWRLPASPSEFRGYMNSIKAMERISGQRIERPNHRRSKKGNGLTGFSMDAAALEAAQRRLKREAQEKADEEDRERRRARAIAKARREKELSDIRWLMH